MCIIPKIKLEYLLLFVYQEISKFKNYKKSMSPLVKIKISIHFITTRSIQGPIGKIRIPKTMTSI